MRDDSGSGSSDPWTVALRHESGASFTVGYEVPGPGSYSASWRLESAPLSGTWTIEARSGNEVAHTSVVLGNGPGLAAPSPTLSTDEASIEWPAVAGAAAYLCRVYGGGALQLEQHVTGPSCDLSGLPPGAYSASIVALSFETASLQGDLSKTPMLPSRFDVSEGRVGFARSDGSTPGKSFKAVGGAYDNGVGQRSLAVWLAIANPDGSPVASDWVVEIVGPNLPAENPLVVRYAHGFPRLMAWAVGVPATIGTYTAMATSGADVAVTQFTVGAPAWLTMPSGLVATEGAQGSARATWDPVAGAGNYLASAYDSVTGALVASQWTPATATDFVTGTFTPGRSYDVFIAVSNVDMVGGAVPTQVSVAENVFDYSTFLAK